MKRVLNFLFLVIIFFPLLAKNNKIYITGDYSDVPFIEFVKDVEQITGTKFYYMDEWVENIKISATGDSLLLNDILQTHFANSELHFFIDNNTKVFISKGEKLVTSLPDYKQSDIKENEEQTSHTSEDGLTETQRTFLEVRKNAKIQTKIIGDKQSGYSDKTVIIKGKITDKETGTPLIGATIYFEKLLTGSVTDLNGFFTISVESGKHEVMINCLGKKEIHYLFDVYSSGTIEIEMEKTLIPIDEVTVKADRFHNVKGLQMGFERISIKEIKGIPVVLGEKDVLKVAQMLPGVQNVGEGSSGFYVRGSAADQNMFYISNVPVYNTSHLFGFFTSFSPDIVKDFSFYKSNIPAQYGGRLSSLFDINTRQGNKKNYTARGGLSPITGHITAEGPIRKERSSFIVTARSTYSDWLLSRLHDEDLRNSKANFYDMAANLTFDIKKNNLLKIFGYYSFDKFSLAVKDHYKYCNAGFSVNWWHQYSLKHNSETSIIYSNYSFQNTNKIELNAAYKQQYNIKHYEFKTIFSWFPIENHKLIYGFNIIKYELDRGGIDPADELSLRIPVNLGRENALEGAVYLSDEYRVTYWLSLYAGIRYSLYGYYGPKLVYEYEPDSPKSEHTIIKSRNYSGDELVNSYSRPEWRGAVNLSTGSNSSIKLSYNRTSQYLFILSNTIAISPTDQWKLCDPHITPPYGDQYSIGYYKNIYSPSIDLSAELYYKDINDIIEYKDGANLLFNENVEIDIIQGNQNAYGIELMAKKNTGKLTGWLSYCYSRSIISVDGKYDWQKVNNGLAYPSNYDKPHSYNGVINYKFNRRFSISSNIIYSTGRPVTYPLTIYYVDGLEQIFYSARNKYRIPDYFRIDLSFNVEGNLLAKKLAHSYFMINIYNLSGRKNAYSVYFRSEEGYIKGYKMSIFGRPIVTISWNFKLGNYTSE
jgi:hypothetical protein